MKNSDLSLHLKTMDSCFSDLMITIFFMAFFHEKKDKCNLQPKKMSSMNTLRYNMVQE